MTLRQKIKAKIKELKSDTRHCIGVRAMSALITAPEQRRHRVRSRGTETDAAQRCIVVPEKLGVKGLCTVEDGRVKVALEHGLMGTAVVGTVKTYIEEKLEKLFA